MSTIRAVYLDTSILIQGGLGGIGSHLQSLSRIREFEPFELLIPELCRREYVEHHARKIKERRDTFSRSKYRRPDVSADDFFMAREDLQKIFDEDVAAVGAAVIDTAEVDLAELLRAAVVREPPFADDGTGFKDAVILATVCEDARRFKGAEVALLAQDGDYQQSILSRRGGEVGVTIHRAQSVEEAGKKISEKAWQAITKAYNEFRREVIVLVEQRRDEVLERIRQTFRADEDFFLRDGDPLRALIGRFELDKILKVDFGEFKLGGPVVAPSFVLGLPAADERAVSLAVDASVSVRYRFEHGGTVGWQLPSGEQMGALVGDPVQTAYTEHEVRQQIEFQLLVTVDAEEKPTGIRVDSVRAMKPTPREPRHA